MCNSNRCVHPAASTRCVHPAASTRCVHLAASTRDVCKHPAANNFDKF